ncbi:Acidic repeat-containing protein [Trachymyrmex cornetzi]|uniref:Acidic repeat-containing protein n=2 Tax=Trachymyrmex cornetzi TaxID=471704 RepID=A0A195DCE6_9HYME|nr:Acidic repeat-containing protein [Trachymyrmex cornetzi]
MSNWYPESSACGSQNFKLRLSEDSTESTEDSSPQRFVANKTKDEDDVIVISDSSYSLSPERPYKSKWESNSNVKSKEHQKLYFLDISSKNEQEKEPDLLWNCIRADDKFSKEKSASKIITQVNKALTESSLISNDISTADRLFNALLTSDSLTNDKTTVSSGVSDDRDQVNKSKKFFKSKKHVDYRSPTLSTQQEINSKLRKKYNTEKTNKVTKLSYNVHNGSPNVLCKHPIYSTPKQISTGKVKLTKKDTYKILNNIKRTQVMYDSPRESKKNNVIIDESTDIDEDAVHPAISPSYNRKVQHPGDNSDVIDSSLKNDISRTDLPEPSKSHIDISRVMNSYRPLSERRQKQIKEWLSTNFSDSHNQSDCSFNTVPPSTRNSNSANNSLERLEQNYETPNNRGKINKTQTDGKQKTIVNSDKMVHSFLKGQTTMDQYFKKSKNNSKLYTPDNKPRLLPKAQTEKKASSVNTCASKTVMNCANILDKVYGTSWRDKANALLSTTKSRKPSDQPINKIIQTERKPVSRNQHCTIISDSDKSDSIENNIKPNRGRNIQRKQKEMDDFINDESLSSNDSGSIYHSAVTNPINPIFTSSTTKSIPASIKRLQTICDTDTEDEDDESRRIKNVQRTLSFSDDESSNTSEFDPGDYIPPKHVRDKEVAKRQLPSKVAPKFESTVTKSVSRYKTFLASLSNTIPMFEAHPNTKKYRLDYKNNKEELCKKLYQLYNEKVFDNKLPQDMSIEWNVRMRGTAGYCYNRKFMKGISGTINKSSRIVLATKILDTPDRLRDTLIHEMCHAACWIIDNVSDGHGVFWTRWATKAIKTFPELPPIRRCHNYEIKTKYTYKCTNCGYSIGRHSKSLDIEKKRCGYCYGKFELLINKITKSGTTVQVQTPKREPTGFALYVKQNYNSVKKEKNNMKHADVMKLLGQQFSAIKIAKKNDVASN